MFAKYSTPEDFVNLELTHLEELIKGVGIYRNKAKHIKALAQIIIEEYDGKIPEDLEELIKLPGVGRKTTNVFLVVGLNKPGLGVDTHVQRVANRIGLVVTQNPTQIELSLKKEIPQNRWGEAHHLFIFHGRRVCRARKPDCQNFSIFDICDKKIDK